MGRPRNEDHQRDGPERRCVARGGAVNLESIVIYGLIAFVVVKVGAVICALIAGSQAGNEQRAREWKAGAIKQDAE